MSSLWFVSLLDLLFCSSVGPQWISQLFDYFPGALHLSLWQQPQPDMTCAYFSPLHQRVWRQISAKSAYCTLELLSVLACCVEVLAIILWRSNHIKVMHFLQHISIVNINQLQIQDLHKIPFLNKTWFNEIPDHKRSQCGWQFSLFIIL